MKHQKITQTQEKQKAIYEYYLERLQHYREIGLAQDIRIGRIYEEVSDRYFLSPNYIGKIISRQLKNGNRH